ncbi:MAG: xanthine dehydrogenase accessory protein XdhC [Burkholderiales bacterium]
MADARWIPELTARVEREGRAVLVTLANATGSTPRESGTAMIVSPSGAFGTIGGGHLEFEALRVARDALAQTALPAPWIVRFPLAARLGQCCGGVATLAFAVIAEDNRAWLDDAVARERAGLAMDLATVIGGTRQAHTIVEASGGRDRAQIAQENGVTRILHTIVPESFAVLVFGNGHVGRALVQVLGVLPARVRWIDEREADFPSGVTDHVEIVATDAAVDEIAGAPRGAMLVITTHTHALDFDLVSAALARDDWRYLGLIGSTSKRNQFERRLLARGFTAPQVARITCPIGRTVPVRSKHPGAIAVAVAAELLAIWEAHREVGSESTFSSHAKVGSESTFSGTVRGAVATSADP